jgi:hypothetical protein
MKFGGTVCHKSSFFAIRVSRHEGREFSGQSKQYLRCRLRRISAKSQKGKASRCTSLQPGEHSFATVWKLSRSEGF